MPLNIQSAENPSMGISAIDAEGHRVEILHVGCTIRPGSGVHLSIEVLNSSLVTENLADVQAELSTFVDSVFARATSMGLPVPAVGGVSDG